MAVALPPRLDTRIPSLLSSTSPITSINGGFPFLDIIRPGFLFPFWECFHYSPLELLHFIPVNLFATAHGLGRIKVFFIAGIVLQRLGIVFPRGLMAWADGWLELEVWEHGGDIGMGISRVCVLFFFLFFFLYGMLRMMDTKHNENGWFYGLVSPAVLIMVRTLWASCKGSLRWCLL